MTTAPTPDELADAADMAEVEEQNLGAEATVPPDLAAAIAEGDRLGDAFRERTRGMERITGEDMRTVVGGPYVCEAMPGVDVAAACSVCGWAPCDPTSPDHTGERPVTACDIVANGGPYQITDKCVHISERELADRDATIASLRERLDAALSELGTLRRLHHGGDATIADLRQLVYDQDRALREAGCNAAEWRQRADDLTRARDAATAAFSALRAQYTSLAADHDQAADRGARILVRIRDIARTYADPRVEPDLAIDDALDRIVAGLDAGFSGLQRAARNAETDRDRSHRLHQRALAANRKLRAGKRSKR